MVAGATISTDGFAEIILDPNPKIVPVTKLPEVAMVKAKNSSHSPRIKFLAIV